VGRSLRQHLTSENSIDSGSFLVTAMNKALRKSKYRGLAVTKRGGAVALNVARLGISIKELATLY